MIKRFLVLSCVLALAFTYCSGSISAFSLNLNTSEHHFLTVLSDFPKNLTSKFILSSQSISLLVYMLLAYSISASVTSFNFILIIMYFSLFIQKYDFNRIIAK